VLVCLLWISKHGERVGCGLPGTFEDEVNAAAVPNAFAITKSALHFKSDTPLPYAWSAEALLRCIKRTLLATSLLLFSTLYYL
jgi:hypothetical protein